MQDEKKDGKVKGDNIQIDKEIFYYLRDKDGHPRITVCLLIPTGSPSSDGEEIGLISRGIAICSLMDQPCKAVGRRLSEHRALRALKKGIRSDPLKRVEAARVFSTLNEFGKENIRKLLISSYGFYKSVMNPSLTALETKLIFGSQCLDEASAA